jgi:hypothetical protein
MQGESDGEMVKKSDIVRGAVREQDWKKALQIAKDFRIGVTQEQRNKMTRAYECIVHPDFYRQIGVDIPEAIEQGRAIVSEYAESIERKSAMMKWDVKHDRAKRVIDAFLENADYWQEREDLAEGLTDEEKNMVSEEVALMISSIRKRYKLDIRLHQNESHIRTEGAQAEIPMDKLEETAHEPVNENKEADKKGKEGSRRKKEPVRKPRVKKVGKEDGKSEAF